MLAGLHEDLRRYERDVTKKHFRLVYGDRHQSLPLWMVCELMSGGSVLDFADGVAPNIQKQVAADFGFPDQQLLSWMKAVFSLRNACAHHARVWNRVFGVKPSIPGKNKNPDWHIAPMFDVSRIGMLMTVLHYWIGKISTTSQWKLRLFALFDEFPEIPLAEMGIPADWRSRSRWL